MSDKNRHAVALGRIGGSRPKKYDDEELAKRRQRMAEARQVKARRQGRGE